MSAEDVPLTVAQHRVVRETLHVVDEQALKIARGGSAWPRRPTR